MDYTGIAKTGGALTKILQAALVPEVVPYADKIGLCEPQEKDDYSLGIWLYDIKECPELRSYRPITVDGEKQKYPPIYVKLYYMITPHAGGDPKYRAQEEAAMLGGVIRAFADTAKLRWQGKNAANGLEQNSRITLLELPMEDKIRIYHAPDGGYKTSLFYEVGPVELESEKQYAVRRVVDATFTVEETEIARKEQVF